MLFGNRLTIATLSAMFGFAAPAHADAVQSYVAAIAATLDPRVARTLSRLDGTGRQMLALRSYLRRADTIAAHWSWTQAQIDSYAGSAAQRILDAEIDRVRQSFELRDPGYSLFVNPQVRSLEIQIIRWNTNRSVSTASDELLKAANALLGTGHFPAAGTAGGSVEFARFLKSYSPKSTPTIAAPGLSSHGQMRAVDFQVRRGVETVAGPDTTTIDSIWRGQGWRDKLHAAVATSLKFPRGCIS